MKKILYTIFMVTSLMACNEKKHQSEALHAHESEQMVSNHLMLTESQVKLANISTRILKAEAVEGVLASNARLKSNEELTELISARASGRIDKLYIKDTGKEVIKGQPLYELYSEQLITMVQDYLLAKAQYDSIKLPRYADYVKSATRKLKLYGLTEKQISELSPASAGQSRIVFMAPASGTIKEISVTEGQYVTEGDALYRLENTNQLWLEAELYPYEARKIRVGDRINVRVAGYEHAETEAVISFLTPEYQVNSILTVVRASLKNPDNLWRAGMAAQVFLSEATTNVLSVPLDAVIRDANGAYVFVQTDVNTFEPRSVLTGLENSSKIVLTSGVKEGEQIVVSGTYLLYSELILKNGSGSLSHAH